MKNRGLGSFVLLALLSACEQQMQVVLVPGQHVTQTRTLEISSDENLYKPSVKVVLMVDNSNSMQDEQTLLADGIGKMMDSLRGMKEVNVDFFVYTTTSLDKDLGLPHSAAAAATNISVPSRPALRLGQSPDVSLGADYVRETLLGLAAPVNSSNLQIRVGMSADAFAVIKESLSQSIASIGTSGATDEAGLCTIGRVIAEDSQARILSPGDKVALIVISDMNDSSQAGSCLKKTSQLFRFDNSDRGNPIPVQVTDGSAEWNQYEMAMLRPGVGASYRFTYDFADSEIWTMKVRTTSSDPADWTAQYHVIYRDSYSFKYSANYSHSNSFVAHYTYQYTGSCPVDGQLRPCTKTSAETTVAFVPSAIGMSAPTTLASMTGNACPAQLTAHLQQQVLPRLSPPGISLSSCSYSVQGTTGAPSGVLIDPAMADGALGLIQSPPSSAPTGTGAPAPVTKACPQALRDHVISSRGLSSDAIFLGCTYTYSETLAATPSQEVLPKPASIAAGSGTTSCASPLVATAQGYLSSNYPGKAYRNCRYTYNNPVSVLTVEAPFDPTLYKLNPPSASALSRQSDGSYLAANVNCPTSLPGVVPPSRMIDDARLHVPPGRTYAGCVYDYRATGYVAPVSANLSSSVATGAGLSLPTACNSSAAPCKCAASAGVHDWLKTVSGRAGDPRTCSFYYTAGTSESSTICRLTDEPVNLALNLCSATQNFSVAGSAYANLGAYFNSKCSGTAGFSPDWNSCAKSGWKNTYPNPAPRFSAQAPQSTSIKDALSPGAATLQAAIAARARELFGRNGFFMAGIIHMDPASRPGLTFPDACTPEMAEGEGTAYYELTRELGDSGFVQSICSPDYSPALNKIRDFIIRTSVNNYRIPIEAEEFFVDIAVRRPGETVARVLVANTDYSVNESIVEFAPGVIQSGDTLLFKIGRDVVLRGNPLNP